MLVQFGNNWIQKIPRTAKLDSAYGLVQFDSPWIFSHPIISKLDSIIISILLRILIKGGSLEPLKPCDFLWVHLSFLVVNGD